MRSVTTILALSVAVAAAIGIMRVRERAVPPPPPIASPVPVGDRVTYPAGRAPAMTLSDGQVMTIRSVLNIARPMAFGGFVWNDDGVPPGPVWVRVDLGRQLLSVFRGGHEIGSAIILFGTDGKDTPVGPFKVLAKMKDHQSSIYEAEMPYTMRLTNDGVAIHATSVNQGSATHGCIGVPLEFAARLFDQVAVGGRVDIIPADAAADAARSTT